MTAIHFNEMTVCDGWDTHSKNFAALETELLPMLDQGLSALLDDLHEQCGRLRDDTLVVVMGREFGRTPRIQQRRRPRSLGLVPVGVDRRRWDRRGQVLGAPSDRIGAAIRALGSGGSPPTFTRRYTTAWGSIPRD